MWLGEQKRFGANFYKKTYDYPCLGIDGQIDGCLCLFMTELLIKIFTWFAFLSITSTVLMVGVSGWIYLVRKLKRKTD